MSDRENRLIDEVLGILCAWSGAGSANLIVSKVVDGTRIRIIDRKVDYRGGQVRSNREKTGFTRIAEQGLLFSECGSADKRVYTRRGWFPLACDDNVISGSRRHSAGPGAVLGPDSKWLLHPVGGSGFEVRGGFRGFDIEIVLNGNGARKTGDGFETVSSCVSALGEIIFSMNITPEAAPRPVDSAAQGIPSFDPPLLGCSRPIREVKRKAAKVASSDISVLIHGESGTGKEIVARNIHRLSLRARGPMITLNCMEVQPSLLRAELFGHGRGAFTGASGERAGLVEKADGGTLFIDEVGDMPSDFQAALLRVIQEREIRRLGKNKNRVVDVRFLFATNRNIEKEIKRGVFREDLFYRICGAKIDIPPLRKRRMDILPLALYFLRREAKKNGVASPGLSVEASNALLSYTWMGNVRELINEMERVIAFHGGEKVITEDMLAERIFRDKTGGEAAEGTLPAAVEELEIRMITETLRNYGGNRSKTARVLGISRQGLLNKIRKFKISCF